MAAEEDPFASLLHLEDTLYTTAYTTGLAAGAKAGKIEGRIFGLEKGFEKFAALGTLHGRSVVWGARLTSTQQPLSEKRGEEKQKEEGESVESIAKGQGPKVAAAKEDKEIESALPPLPPLPRLPPHIALLHSLTDPPTFSTANTEDAVADLDDRFKRGMSKAKLIELLIKEPSSVAALAKFTVNGEGGSPRRKLKVVGDGGRKEDNMEDFGGSRLLR